MTLRKSLAALALLVGSPALAANEAQPPALETSILGNGLWTQNLAAELAFWRDGFGMVEVRRLEFGDVVEVILAFSETPRPPMVFLLANKDGIGDANATQVNTRDKIVLSVSDAQAAHARLTAAGYEPGAIKVHAESGSQVFWVSDPDGRRLEVTQPGSASAR
ncbi:MAG: VOC family protein [Sphingomonadaceae bacterium]